MNSKQKYSLSEAKQRISSYCAYQERSHKEVEEKLRSWGIHSEHRDQLIAYLIEYNFLNETRFATLYARSKFNQKSWGWNKIKKGLHEKGILSYNIEQAHKEIDLDDYLERLNSLMLDKEKSLSGSALQVKAKLFRYLTQKGYELNYINDIYKKQHG